MTDLEEMKELWVDLNNRMSILEEDNRKLAREVKNNKFKTAKERLIKKYNAFIIVEIIMIFYVFLFVGFNPMIADKYRTVTLIYWTLFFLIEASFDIYLRERVRNLDIYYSNISEISAQAARNWKIHKIGVLIGLPLAIGAVILFGLAMEANKFVIYGMILGGVIGLLIGLRQLLKFSNYYRLLQSNEDKK